MVAITNSSGLGQFDVGFASVLGPLAAQFLPSLTGRTGLEATGGFAARQLAFEAEQTKRRATTIAIVAGAAVVLGVAIFLITSK